MGQREAGLQLNIDGAGEDGAGEDGDGEDGDGEDGDGAALLVDGRIAVGEDVGFVSVGTCCGKDVTQDISVFLCIGYDVLRLLVLRWVLLERIEGVLCRLCNSNMVSLDLWMLPALLGVCIRQCSRHPMS